jgi:uncharacterized protein (DUF1501 family)
MFRRDFLNLSVLSLASTLGVQVYGLPRNWAQANVSSQKKLFVIFLRGGFDGLSALPSHEGFNELKSLRPNYYNGNYQRLSGDNDAFRVNPRLNVLSESGLGLAIFPHAGSLNPTRSHFEQMDIIEGGDRNRVNRVGYLSRAVGALPTQHHQVAAIGSVVPKSIRGGIIDPLQVTNAQSLKSTLRTQLAQGHVESSGDNGLLERLRFISSRESTDECPEKSRACLSAHNAVANIRRAQLPEDTTNDPFDLAVSISATSFAPRIITIDVGGWDIHRDASDRMNAQGGLLSKLNDGLALMKNKLTQMGQWDNSVIVLMSEFGRTLAINGSAGFDHGRGGLMMVLGGRVRGVQNNRVQRLWDLSPDGREGRGSSQCLTVRNDYRSVMAHILMRHLGVKSADIFNGVFPNFSNGDYTNPQIIS